MHDLFSKITPKKVVRKSGGKMPTGKKKSRRFEIRKEKFAIFKYTLCRLLKPLPY